MSTNNKDDDDDNGRQEKEKGKKKRKFAKFLLLSQYFLFSGYCLKNWMLLQTGKYILAKIAIIWSTSHWNAAGTSLDRKSVEAKISFAPK